ncbi:MAG: hypothetical protein AAGI01_13885 [Myxococcota bacterium]
MARSWNCFALSLCSLALTACAGSPGAARLGSKPVDDAALMASGEGGAAPGEGVPATFCVGDEEEYTRRAYRWCQLGDQMHGRFEAMDGDRLAMEGVFGYGDMNGVWTAYYADGTKRWSTSFEEDQEDGTSRGWYSSGAQHYEISYAAGKPSGRATYWHTNGEVSAKLSFASGAPDGTWTFFHDNGVKSHKYTWTDGKQSVHAHWDRQGEKIKDQSGSLSKSEVRRKVAALEPDVIACFKHSRIFDSSQGKLVVQFVVDYSGDVTRSMVFESDLEHHFVGFCARRAIENLRFDDNPFGPMTLIENWQLSFE